MSSYYVLVSDDDNVVALFKRTVSGDEAIRSKEGWTNPTAEEIEEWDGFTVVTIEEKFVDIYDEMLADGEKVTLETIQPYKTEQD